MKKYIIPLAMAIAIGTSSCLDKTEQQIKAYYPIDSLLNAQINFFIAHKATLEKGTTKKLGTTFENPDTVQWNEQLDLFRKLDINQPSLVDNYEVTTSPDTNSNLQVLRYSALDDDLEVCAVSLYYYKKLDNLKKIKGLIKSNNPLYKSGSELSLEFDQINDTTVLTSYSIMANQKLQLRDSVNVQVFGKVKF